MKCPECGNGLTAVVLKTELGNVELDYCAQCAGVWADQGEVNFIKPKELEPLRRLFPASPLRSTIQYHLCPRDQNTLEIFKGESIPIELEVFRCPHCSGFWFPQGNLFGFKSAQKAKLDYFKQWRIPLPSIYAILLPLFLLTVIGGGVLATVIGIKQGTELRTQAKSLMSKPLVFFPQRGDVVISFTTEKPAIATVKYWLTPDVVSDIVVSNAPQKVHMVTLKNLEVGKTYSYQVIITDPESIVSPIYQFTVRE